MATFKINKSQARKDLITDFESYVRTNYRYFRHSESAKKNVKIVIGKEYITIHIKVYYSVICNDLKFLNRMGLLKASTRSLNWLKDYGV